MGKVFAEQADISIPGLTIIGIKTGQPTGSTFGDMDHELSGPGISVRLYVDSPAF